MSPGFVLLHLIAAYRPSVFCNTCRRFPHIRQVQCARMNQRTDHAISNVLLAEQQKVFVVEGPPGTSKTSTIMGMIVQLLAQGEWCLVRGLTNMAATENAK
ncbi:hypothetical protein AMAG_08893 [Allomyces macrogynus ATCC 38327]|uniref:DNA2/NAM7 helicase helicase domain-containing protein n=1 Tax=Allomyces macrogynus (strain ATCC 38327) TaxID=578462 RepID=A0A0L0SMV7_ALLM3|nr:hypothetical protein AMAG_08893 [Allomyces macrogynus ATCC 38327]|eukprot:KNE63823.1 hypothetical protein AMAG_08893 [Allomyces macrogynus ATCC 38327]